MSNPKVFWGLSALQNELPQDFPGKDEQSQNFPGKDKQPWAGEGH